MAVAAGVLAVALGLGLAGKRGWFVVAALALGAILSVDAAPLLWTPVLINAGLLATFASSLRGTPMVERFARAAGASMSAARIRYCRTVTRVWCAFFVANGAIAAAIAGCGSLEWWALYNGGIAYALMALLFAGELLARRWVLGG
jgi:uncharacterized membrane protein